MVDERSADILDELDANRAMFLALCQMLRTQQLARRSPPNRWSVADHIAHLAAYDQRAVGYFTSVHLAAADAAETLAAADAAGTMKAADATQTLDEWNAAQVFERSGWPLTTLLAEMGNRREQSTLLLRALTPADLDREIVAPRDARRCSVRITLLLWMRQWSKHDMLHARAMLRILDDLAEHLDLRAWLNDDPLVDAMERERLLAPGSSGATGEAGG